MEKNIIKYEQGKRFTNKGGQILLVSTLVSLLKTILSFADRKNSRNVLKIQLK